MMVNAGSGRDRLCSAGFISLLSHSAHLNNLSMSCYIMGKSLRVTHCLVSYSFLFPALQYDAVSVPQFLLAEDAVLPPQKGHIRNTYLKLQCLHNIF